jgi:sulfoxide reductase heme-binding subunit YedZ
VRFARDSLGANPIEEVTHVTGEWALRFLVCSLAVTPIRRFSGWSWLAPERRTFGLLAFLYACLHLSTYVGLDLFFDFSAVGEDILERPYITVGFGSFLLMLPLALTSTSAAIKRMGRSWNRLHSLVYLVAVGAVVHFLWLSKAELLQPAIYGGVVALLLGLRGGRWLARRSSEQRLPDGVARVKLPGSLDSR